MRILFDGKQLSQLFSGIQALSGIRVAACDAEGRELCAGGPRAPFCEMVAGAAGARCARCPFAFEPSKKPSADEGGDARLGEQLAFAPSRQVDVDGSIDMPLGKRLAYEPSRKSDVDAGIDMPLGKRLASKSLQRSNGDESIDMPLGERLALAPSRQPNVDGSIDMPLGNGLAYEPSRKLDMDESADARPGKRPGFEPLQAPNSVESKGSRPGNPRAFTSSREPDARHFRCHALACLAVLPLRSGERSEPLAWLCAGPFLEGESAMEQWISTRVALSGCAVDLVELRRAFLRLRTLSPEELDGLWVALEALADSIQLRGLVLPAGESDLRRLERYLDEHYTEKLSLASVSAALHIGRTRLCALAKELSGGETLFAMVARRRIDAAKALLLRSDRPISAIAEAVGISDYNYFSKIFRASVGISPSEFRKRARGNLGNMV